MSTYYKNIQIVKHALQFYIKRPDANEKEVAIVKKEKKLLKKVKKEFLNE